MTATFQLTRKELNADFFKKLKALVSSNLFSITLEEDMDETEYLVSTPNNLKQLEDAIKNIDEGKTTKIDLNSYLKKK